MRLPLLAALVPALLVAPAAHAGPQGVDTGYVVQGSIAYDCYGCGTTATFSGVATYAGDFGPVTVPVTGPLDVQETCGATQGYAWGSLTLGSHDFQVNITRYPGSVLFYGVVDGNWWAPDLGPGTFSPDTAPGTCGSGPMTASISAVLVPGFNCACMIAGDDS